MAGRKSDRSRMRTRLDVIRGQLIEGWSVQRVVERGRAEWSVSDSSMRRYVARVWKDFAKVRGDRYEAARARAVARYERMVEWAYEHAEQELVRKKIIESPADEEGKRDRRLEVTQEKKVLSGPLQVLMFAARRLELLDGVDRNPPPPEDRKLVVDWPGLWSGNGDDAAPIGDGSPAAAAGGVEGEGPGDGVTEGTGKGGTEGEGRKDAPKYAPPRIYFAPMDEPTRR